VSVYIEIRICYNVIGDYMEYSVQLEIKKPQILVSNLFVDRKTMPLWETGLTRIEDENHSLFNTSSQGYLVFDFNGKESKMKVSVLENKLPNTITIVYELPGAYNQCINTFKPMGNQTLWTMDVIFKFDLEIDVPLEAFIEKTTKGMELFKAFVENQ
jgi:hypothetical protein